MKYFLRSKHTLQNQWQDNKLLPFSLFPCLLSNERECRCLYLVVFCNAKIEKRQSSESLAINQLHGYLSCLSKLSMICIDMFGELLTSAIKSAYIQFFIHISALVVRNHTEKFQQRTLTDSSSQFSCK